MPIFWQGLLWFLVALAIRLVWVWIVPPWQAPDEPLHYEYAAVLAAELRGVPAEQARPHVQRAILQALQDAGFWTTLGQPAPAVLPESFAAAQDPYLGRAGTQVGDEPPLYYVIPALTMAWVPGMIARLQMMRLFSALLTALTVPITWAAARELWPGRPALAFTAAIGVLAMPMFAFIGSSANNDALLVLLACLLAWSVVRGTIRGWSAARLIGLAAILAGLLLTKKQGLALLPAAGVVLWQALAAGLAPRRRTLAAVALGTAALALLAWLAWPVQDQPASWARRGVQGRYGARVTGVAHSGSHALVLPASAVESSPWIAQALSEGAARRLRGERVTLRAWLRADSATVARLVLEDGVTVTERQVLAGPAWQEVRLEAVVAADAAQVRVVLERLPAAGSGTVFADDVSLSGLSREWLANGSAEIVKRRTEGLAARWLRLPPWFAQGLFDPTSYDGEALRRFGLYAALLFPGFWGNFGWLSAPMPLWVYGLIALACAAALVGWLRGRVLAVPGPPAGRGRWWRQPAGLLALLAVFVLLAALLPMIGRDWQPQGRYLYPAITPLALAWAAGWAGWEPRGGRPAWRRWCAVALPNLFMVALLLGAWFGVVIPAYQALAGNGG